MDDTTKLAEFMFDFQETDDTGRIGIYNMGHRGCEGKFARNVLVRVLGSQTIYNGTRNLRVEVIFDELVYPDHDGWWVYDADFPWRTTTSFPVERNQIEWIH